MSLIRDLKQKRIEMASYNSREDALQYLLCSRVYPLNTSCTKKIIIGLAPQKNNDFTCIVKIINQTFFGINFTTAAWQAFKLHFAKINSYFNDEVQSGTAEFDKISFNGITLNFTTSYGTKAILLDKIEEKMTASYMSMITDECVEYQVSKKKKAYSPAIVLQKTTFDGIVNIAECIDYAIQANEKIAATVAQCYTNIIDNICKKFTDNKLLPQTKPYVKQYLHSQKVVIKNTISNNLDKNFNENYFDVIFSELLALHCNVISDAVIAKITTTE